MRDAEDPYLGSYDGDEEALLFTEWIHETAAEEYAPPPTRIARPLPFRMAELFQDAVPPPPLVLFRLFPRPSWPLRPLPETCQSPP